MTTPRINAGTMRHRVNVLVNTPFLDAGNQPQESWSILVSRWAGIESIEGGEFVQQASIRNLSSHTITMRYVPGLNPRNQIEYEGRTFNIVAAFDVDERKIQHLVFCKEVV